MRRTPCRTARAHPIKSRKDSKRRTSLWKWLWTSVCRVCQDDSQQRSTTGSDVPGHQVDAWDSGHAHESSFLRKRPISLLQRTTVTCRSRRNTTNIHPLWTTLPFRTHFIIKLSWRCNQTCSNLGPTRTKFDARVYRFAIMMIWMCLHHHWDNFSSCRDRYTWLPWSNIHSIFWNNWFSCNYSPFWAPAKTARHQSLPICSWKHSDPFIVLPFWPFGVYPQSQRCCDIDSRHIFSRTSYRAKSIRNT